MSLLIVGATGTLGRQIVREALNEGYQVRCMVRNFKKANFLKEWGAELVYGDLSLPETLTPCLYGIQAVIDASTSRPDDLNSLKKIDWYGKLALIEAAKIAKIKHFVFCSLANVDSFSEIPFIQMKKGIENRLKLSGIPSTILRLTGFYQGLIGQYAIPILENQSIWTTDEMSSVFYMDTQDIAKFCVRSLSIEKSKGKIFVLSGLKPWLSSEIISLCEKLAGQKANLNKVSIYLLKFIKQILEFFEWSQNISDRLAFVEILSTKNNNKKSIENLYPIFQFESSDFLPLELYFQEYFIKILKRLKYINFEDIQKQKNLIL